LHRGAFGTLNLVAQVATFSVIVGALAIVTASRNPVEAGAETGDSYVPLAPYRILDTRVTGNPLVSGGTANVTVTDIDSVPTDATAVVLNVTVTDPSSSSYLTVYPAGEATPVVSNLNFSPGETVANLTVVPVGESGEVSMYNYLGTVQVVVDLEGYFEATSGPSTAGSYVALSPDRITDTRLGSGEPNSGSPLGPSGTLNVQVEGAGGVPSSGVEAAVLNVTATDTTQASYMTVYPDGVAMPLASNLNWSPGDTVANRLIVPVGTSGQITIYNWQGDTDVVVDVDGYFTDGDSTPDGASLYYPITPVRMMDSRADAGTIGPASYLEEQLAGVDGISSTASAVVANLTATNPTLPTYFSLSPSAPGQPTTSDLNVAAGATVPNLAVASLSGQGAAYIYNSQGTADLIVDAFGYFQPESPTGSSAPAPCTESSLNANVGTSTQGTPVTVDASSDCPAGSTASYQYWIQSPYSSAWVLAQSWDSSDSYSYNTVSWAPGTYTLAVWVSSDNVYQSVASSTSVLSDATDLVTGITYSPQLEGMTCEEATLQMGLSHEGISVSQQQILNAEGVNESVPGIGPAYTRADPMVNFVGYPNGGSGAGYEPGAYYGAIVDAADELGGDVIAAGEGITPTQVYNFVYQNHPVEVWVTFNFHVEYATTWLTNGVHTWPWAGPDEHAVLIVGIENNSVLIDNPWPAATDGAEYFGQDQWVPMSTFQSVYGVYGDMAVVFN
jgi:uncharacterized protein YvpB